MPRSGKVQIIALCDGWVSKTTDPNQRTFVMGQLFPINDEDELNVTVEMEKTGSLELSIRTADGTPVDGGVVSSWPNQKYYKGGSTVLGARYSSLQGIKNQLLPAGKHKPTYSRDYTHLPFMDQLVKNGKTTLSGLPVGRNNSLLIRHPEFTFEGGGDMGEVSFNIESSETKQLTFKVKPIKR